MAKFCQNCGNKLNDNADMCLNCGILIKKENSQRNNNEETGAWSLAFIIPIIIVIIPIILVLLSYIFSVMAYTMY